MRADKVQLGFANLATATGSHIAYLYQDEATRRSRVLSFISAGLQGGEKCILAMSEYPPECWSEWLSDWLKDMNPGGALTILTPDELDYGSGYRPSVTLQSVIARAVEDAFDAGWDAVRVCTSFSHQMYDERAAASILSDEISADETFAGRPVTVLCTLDSRRLPPRLLDIYRNCHPILTDGYTLSHNFAYMDPMTMAKEFDRLMDEPARAGEFCIPFARISFHDGVPIVHVGTELDFCSVPEVEELTLWLVSMEHRMIVIDLSDTTYMDAASVRAIAKLAVVLIEKHGQLAILDPADPPRKLFELIDLGNWIPIGRTCDEAMRAVRPAHV